MHAKDVKENKWQSYEEQRKAFLVNQIDNTIWMMFKSLWKIKKEANVNKMF